SYFKQSITSVEKHAHADPFERNLNGRPSGLCVSKFCDSPLNNFPVIQLQSLKPLRREPLVFLLEYYSIMCVSQVTRLFEGTEYEFRVAACNSAGTGPFSGPSDTAFAVDPINKPGPPASVKITKVFADRIKLRWEPPLADGGSEITNYIIEKRETSRANWALVTSNIHGHITDCSVEKLIEGHEYQFRVSAENQYGVGDPTMTDAVTVKNPYGKRTVPRST
uniref:Fibronectin type-III domain-containing protein n=1 Tax=Amphilophus citrinellus TaxID=61819 RepID=A0A3Q0QVS9_AMPCI